ncbi:DNA methyltransferase [Prevotella sp. RM4]|uniref:DNA methyltransferase n=1 Tax=Prevotella sp. RM4 TaxID=1200547 RepID=UPI00051BB684
MTDKQQSAAAAAFAERWKGRGYERGESQPFWIDLLSNVYGIDTPTNGFITFEDHRMVDSSNFIDGRIPSTKVLIEQKSLGKDLRKGIVQSDGSLLNPFQQARRYVVSLPVSEHPRWIVTCNFSEFLVYDMEQPNGEPEQILLENLGKEYYRLQFLVDAKNEHLRKEMEVSMQAGEIVGRIYEALLKQYDDNSPEALRWLNILCVRIVFCLYAEDAGIFSHDQFHDFLVTYEAKDLRRALRDLFEVLNTPKEQRSKYLQAELAAFPYTNGGLFAETIEIPQFTDELKQKLLQNASLDFDWSEISPTIFGAVFESTLNPETRRSGGMHYTSIENIHKVIDPLFLNDLRAELDEILDEKVEKQRVRKLDAYQDKLASLTFLDPACGSGNFLTETYLSLRRLENEAIRSKYHDQTMIGAFMNPIKVSIHQFYGIEINDFAVTVATTALWISEAQMMAETEKIVTFEDNFLPLKSYSNIHEGNALRTDWETVVPKSHLTYIIGNPPFVGANIMNDNQRADIRSIFGSKWKNIGEMDYVTGWYLKATQMMHGTDIRTALVSTNSISQGEQVANLWKPLFEKEGVHIDFAHRTFRWDSEASLKAHVHCVIIGFSCTNDKHTMTIYDNAKEHKASNINAYLMDAPNVFVESKSKPLCRVPSIRKGNQPTDGGNLIIEAADLENFLACEPKSRKFIKRLIGSKEYINNKARYCLWLKEATPAELRQMPTVLNRIEGVRKMRESSSDEATRRLANYPHLFRETNNPETYIVVPSVSSERRRYVPMGFLTKDTIPTNLVLIIPDATLYHFGILISNVHMAWMRAVCGRLKSDYRYSKDIVYNNFPWPIPTEEQKAKIEQTAQAILDARALYPDSSLADLYDELTMPVELRKAHQENDRAVMAAYGFPIKTTTESQCVAELFKLYQELTNKNQ